MKAIIVFVCTVLLSCQSDQETKVDNDKKFGNNDSLRVLQHDSLTNLSSTAGDSFFDSVLKKQELSIEQIKKYTTIDSMYYTGFRSKAVFRGDTVVDFKNSLKGVVIEFDDGLVCSYKDLLIFNQSYDKNINEMKVYINCDGEEGEDYHSIDYKIISDSIFETIRTTIPANAEEKNLDDIIIKYKWKINSSGAIDSAR